MELIDSIRIMSLRPGDYRRIANFAESLPSLKTSGLWVHSEFAQKHPETIVSLMTHLLKVHRRIKEDPKWFVSQVPRFLEIEESELALLPEIVEALLAIDNFPIDGSLSMQDAQNTIDFFVKAGRLESGLQAADVYDLSFLQTTLQALGLHD